MWQQLHAEHTALAGDRWFGIRHRRFPSYDLQLGDSQERDRLHGKGCADGAGRASRRRSVRDQPDCAMIAFQIGVGVVEDWLATMGGTVCAVAGVAQKHNARKSNMAISALAAYDQDAWFGLIPIASVESSVQLASI